MAKQTNKETNKEVKNTSDCYSRICKADPYRDAAEMVPDLAVSIDDMLQTGVVKDSGETLDNNGIEDPNLIVGRVRDTFDAMDAARIVKKYGRKPAKAQSEVNQVIQNSSNQPE